MRERPPGIYGRTARRMLCRLLVGSLPRTSRYSRRFVNKALMREHWRRYVRAALRLRCTASVLLRQQPRAAVADCGLRGLRKALQQPRQHHLDPHVIVGDIEMA